MGGSAIVNNIITGIIAGVSAGLILAAFSYAKQYIDHKMERHEQIKYIRQIVEDFQESILSTEEVISAPGAPSLTNMPDAVRKFRWGSLDHTYKEIVRTLEGRANTLTFDEKKQVRDAFSLYDLFRTGGAFGDRGLLMDEAGYHDIFDKLEAIEWLKVKRSDRIALGPRPP